MDSRVQTLCSKGCNFNGFNILAYRPNSCIKVKSESFRLDF